MRNQKVQVSCSLCKEERLISLAMVRLIERKLYSGNCLKCSSKFKKPMGGRKPHSEETKRKMSIAKLGVKKSKTHAENISKAQKGRAAPWATGENNWKWIKDRSLIKLGDRSLNDSLQKKWRMDIKRRDKFTCRIADNNCGGRLEVHHILRWSEFPELRYQVNNGITLCHAHHPRKRAEEKRLIPTFQELVSVSK